MCVPDRVDRTSAPPTVSSPQVRGEELQDAAPSIFRRRLVIRETAYLLDERERPRVVPIEEGVSRSRVLLDVVRDVRRDQRLFQPSGRSAESQVSRSVARDDGAGDPYLGYLPKSGPV